MVFGLNPHKKNKASYRMEYRRWQKEHPNFMTPNVITTHQKGDYIIEVSEGRGFEEGSTIYGVSVIKKDGNKFIPTGHKYADKSKPFDNELSALNYANKLKKEIK